ncbi:MAG: hypothetical protein ACFCD0_01615 [Gemmataceae bacterium]
MTTSTSNLSEPHNSCSTPRSPMRCLLASARNSRAKWKAKAQERQQQIKKLKVRLYDLEKSRQNHAQNAQNRKDQLRSAQQTIEQLQLQLQHTKDQLQQPQQPTPTNDNSTPKKKKRHSQPNNSALAKTPTV